MAPNIEDSFGQQHVTKHLSLNDLQSLKAKREGEIVSQSISFPLVKQSSPSRRIIFPVIHINKTTGTEYSTTESQNSSNESIVLASSPISILRRKTSSQSSLSIISEDRCSQTVQGYNKDKEIPPHQAPPTTASTSSIPSLVSNNSWCSNDCHFDCLDMSSCLKKPNTLPHKCVGVSFDPRVLVHEYEQDKEELMAYNWYNAAEIEEFKKDAMACIQGTRRLIGMKLLKVVFNYPDLVSGCNSKHIAQHELLCSQQNNMDLAEIKHILIVDPNELFLSLFKRGFQCMLPNASVITANSSQNALNHIKAAHDSGCNPKATHGFDIVVIEERLLPTIAMQHQFLIRYKNNQTSTSENLHSSGSCLIQKLALERKERKKAEFSNRYTFIIGVSAHHENCHEHTKLSASGADIVWKKPPPSMDQRIRNELLQRIIEKRRI